ncbi:TPA: hypothetical protein ACHWHD_004211 [Providencia stuartii]
MSTAQTISSFSILFAQPTEDNKRIIGKINRNGQELIRKEFYPELNIDKVIIEMTVRDIGKTHFGFLVKGDIEYARFFRETIIKAGYDVTELEELDFSKSKNASGK